VRRGARWGPRLVVAGAVLLALNTGWPLEPRPGVFPGLLLTLAALAPALRRWARPEEGAPMPILPLLGVLHALYYGVPLLIGGGGSPRWAPLAGGLALGGWALFCAGHRARLLAAFPRPLRLDFGDDRAQTRAAFAFVGLGAVLARLVPAGAEASSLGQLAVLLPELERVGIGLLALLAFRGALSGPRRLLLWAGLVPLHLAVQLVTGSIANLAWFGLFLVLLAWGRGKRVPVLLLLLSALVLGIFRGVAEAYRVVARQRAEASFVERVSLFRAALDGWMVSGSPARERTLELMRRRTDHAALLAMVQEKTPGEVPYWKGESYRHFPASFVPRVLWPGKPSKRVGQEFGHRYAVLAPDDRTTSVNLPLLVELQANFGAGGALLGMAVLGALYALLQSGLNRRGMGDGGLVIGAYVLARLLNVESDFSLVFGAVPYKAAFLWFALRLAGARSVGGAR
jgi:hypothetical protein